MVPSIFSFTTHKKVQSNLVLVVLGMILLPVLGIGTHVIGKLGLGPKRKDENGSGLKYGI
jgi:hypothetical protein